MAGPGYTKPSGKVTIPAKTSSSTKNNPAPGSSTWWDLYGADSADLNDYFWVSGLGSPQAVSRVQGAGGHIFVGSPQTGWYDPKAPYGRDQHGHPITPKYGPTLHGKVMGQTEPSKYKGLAASKYTNGQIIKGFLGSADPSGVQYLLKQGGFYGTATPVYGSASSIDAGAMQDAYQSYKQSKLTGQTFQGWLGHRADLANAQGTYALNKRKAPEVVTYTNPLDIQGAVGPEASQVLGRGLSDADMQKYINDVHAGEKSAADQSYRAHGAVYDPSTGQTDTGPGGGVTAPASLSQATVDAKLKQDHPDQYQAAQMGERGAQLLALMDNRLPGGTGSGAV